MYVYFPVFQSKQSVSKTRVRQFPTIWKTYAQYLIPPVFSLTQNLKFMYI